MIKTFKTYTFLATLFIGFLFLISPLTVFAQTNVSGSISTDTTWAVADSPFIVQGSITISSGITLTVEPGVVVKFEDSFDNHIAVYGSLDVQGTALNKVYFTSAQDDSVGGDTNGDGNATTPAPEDWAQIRVFEGGQTNINHTEIRYGGSAFIYNCGFPAVCQGGLHNQGGVIFVTNSKISQNGKYGIDNQKGTTTVSTSEISFNEQGLRFSGRISATKGGELTISNSTISNNTDIGVYAHGSLGSKLILNNNTFLNNTKDVRLLFIDFDHTNNTSSGSTNTGFYIASSFVDNALLKKDNMPYVVEGFIALSSGNTTTIDPGVVIKFTDNAFLDVRGDLFAQGTEEDKIVFTSIKDDFFLGDTNGDAGATTPAPEDWAQIRVFNDALVNLSHTNLRYGGFESSCGFPLACRGVVVNNGGILNIDSSKISQNGRIGVDHDRGVTVISNSEISENLNGIDLTSNNISGSLTIHNSSIHDNNNFGIQNLSPIVVNAIGNWWGDSSGPFHLTENILGQGNEVSDRVDFIPFLTLDPINHPRTPVVVVPGITGSKLNKKTLIPPNLFRIDEVWPNFDAMLFSKSDDHLDDLILDNNGATTTNLILGDIFREKFVFDFFEGLINELESNGYEEGVDLFVFSYDWRLKNEYNAGQLKVKIDEILNQTGKNQADIVAHSMGGLVSKYYIKHLSNSSVRKFVDISTPHLGSPETAKTLLYGDNLGIPFLNTNKINIISQNMPSIYQLLPSLNYFDLTDSDYEYYLFDLKDFDEDSITGRLTHNQSLDFLSNTGRNSTLLSEVDAFHNDLDNWSGSDFGVNTTNIVGCGLPTIGKIFINDKEETGGFKYALVYIDGDETIPLRSAESIGSDNVYYVNNESHATMSSASGVRQLVSSVLTDLIFDLSSYSNISENKDNCGFSGKVFSVHSPVELHVYDSQDRHMGPVENGDTEVSIPGAVYDVIEDNKFAFLPEGGTYRVEMIATDTGSFGVDIETIENVAITNTLTYTNIPLTTASTTAKITLAPSQIDFSIKIDQDGDGNFETVVQPDGTELSLEELIQKFENKVLELELENSLKMKLLNSLEKIKRELEKNHINSEDKILKTIKKMKKELNKAVNKGDISEDSADTLLSILEEISIKL
jgi:hypothetical protein